MSSLPIASVRLFDVGDGDPYVTDHGLAYYEPIGLIAARSTFSLDTNGLPHLRTIEELGLVCWERIEELDTQGADWTTTGGAWQDVRPTFGGDTRKYRLVQYSSAADTAWSAVSDWRLPEDPSFAFSLVFTPSPPDNDEASYPQFARLEFGGEADNDETAWGIEFSSKGAKLGYYDVADAAWHTLLRLPEPPARGEEEETVACVRVQRGRLGVSLDGGLSYTLWPQGGGTASIPMAKVTVRGQGCVAAWGLHRLLYVEGTLTSPERNTFKVRGATIPTLTAQKSEPTGATVALADASTPASALAAWAATLTPAETILDSRSWYSSPELYGVAFQYALTASTPANGYTTPWDDALTSITVDKPFALHEGGATIRFLRNAMTAFSGNYRYRKVQILLGWQDGGSKTWWTVFTGYIQALRAAYDRFGRAVWEVRCVNLAELFKRDEWGSRRSLPLGGQSLNAANDAILALKGLGSSYRSWHARGDALLLPWGTPENPFEWPPRGEKLWETLERINGYAGLEVGVTDLGILATVPLEYVASSVSRDYVLAYSATAEEQVGSLSLDVDYGEMGTAVEVWAEGEDGGEALAWAEDTGAESDPTNARFCGWRMPVSDTASGAATPALLSSRAGALARELFALKVEPELVLLADLNAARRQLVTVTGAAGVGIADGSQAVILSLRHTFEIDDRGGVGLVTAAGVRML